MASPFFSYFLFYLLSVTPLRLNANNFSQFIPLSLGNLTNPVDLYLEENNISGNIPAELAMAKRQ